MKKVIIISFAALYILILISCTENPVPPVVSTNSVTEITTTSAVSGGVVTNNGGANVTERGVCWNTSENPTIDDNFSVDTWDDSVTLSFTSNLSDLLPNTLYFVRAYASTVAGTGYGNTESFTTLGDEPSSVILDASNIETHSATLNGTVNPGQLSTSAVFEYGISTDYGNTISASESPVEGDTSLNVSAGITELTPGTTYHFRIKVENSLGIVYSNDNTFTTSGQLPDVTDVTVTVLTLNEATLNSSVNPNLLLTTVVFEYGTSTDYGNIISPDENNINGIIYYDISAGLTGLTPGTTYHSRIKATNELGTTYSNDLIFKTFIVADADNNLYHSVIIGTQEWMQENLSTTHYNDGSSIPLVSGNTEWGNLSAPGYCWYNNDENNKVIHGALYNWYTVNTGKLCPSGWHVPVNGEWITLANYLGGESVAGDKLKESGSTHWGDLNRATNSTGFTALPGGYRTEEGFFVNIGVNALLWSSSILLPSSSYSAILYNNSSNLSRTGTMNTEGLSVRCLRD